MSKLILSLINPKGNLTLYLQERFDVEVFVDTPEDGTAELLYDNNIVLTDVNKKVKTMKRGKTTIKWVLTALRPTTKPSSVAVKVTTKKDLRIVQVNIEILQ